MTKNITSNDNPSSMKSLVAYEKIRDMILTGEKLPGTRLILTDLEMELAIGRGPIREAIMRLDRSGLVKNIPYKGAVVGFPPLREEIIIIFNMRIELESHLAVKAIKNITEKQIGELEQLQSLMSNLGSDFYTLDRKFHSIIHDASKLPHLIEIGNKLVESVETYLTLYSHEKNDCIKFSNEHFQILDSIKAKDAGAVRTAMQTNILSGLKVAERSFARLDR